MQNLPQTGFSNLAGERLNVIEVPDVHYLGDQAIRRGDRLVGASPPYIAGGQAAKKNGAIRVRHHRRGSFKSGAIDRLVRHEPTIRGGAAPFKLIAATRYLLSSTDCRD